MSVVAWAWLCFCSFNRFRFNDVTWLEWWKGIMLDAEIKSDAFICVALKFLLFLWKLKSWLNPLLSISWHYDYAAMDAIPDGQFLWKWQNLFVKCTGGFVTLIIAQFCIKVAKSCLSNGAEILRIALITFLSFLCLFISLFRDATQKLMLVSLFPIFLYKKRIQGVHKKT